MKTIPLLMLVLAGCSFGKDRGFGVPPPAELPVRVCFDAALTDFDDSFDAAMALWNDAADGALFRRDCATPTLRVLWSSYDGTYSMRYSRSRNVIEVARAVDTAQVYLDLAHELGHAVGLAHDDYGIMKEQSDWQPWEDAPDHTRAQSSRAPWPRVTDGDRARVRGLLR